MAQAEYTNRKLVRTQAPKNFEWKLNEGNQEMETDWYRGSDR